VITTEFDKSEWYPASRNNPCLICGKTSWCSLSGTGDIAICRREANGAISTKIDRSGVEYHIHTVTGQSNLRERGFSKPKIQARIAPLELRDQVYTFLLNEMPLDPKHYRDLLDRTFDLMDIERALYATLSHEKSYEIAEKCIKKFGEEVCAQIPGLAFFTINKQKLWQLVTLDVSALAIPSRNKDGLIQAIKLRPDWDEPDRKYIYWSSRYCDGPSAESSVHVPIFKNRFVDLIRVTEGELKADLATLKTHVTTLSVPGVQSWRLALPVLKKFNADQIRLAFDMDSISNPKVAKSLYDAFLGFKEAGLRVEVESWQ
jgi:hypothetical protein